MKFHPLTWCIWSVSALAAAFLDRNPFLQVALLMVLINAWLPYRERHAVPHWKLAIVLATVPVVFSVALSRFGHHLLFSLPSIPIIGGAWTLEALVFGASTGMALLLVIGAFAILQSTVRSADLVALLPRPLYRGGTVFALAITFAPQTMTSLNSIMEARRIRHQRTGWRAAPQLLLPLLLTTLERALQYAESLERSRLRKPATIPIPTPGVQTSGRRRGGGRPALTRVDDRGARGTLQRLPGPGSGIAGRCRPGRHSVVGGPRRAFHHASRG